MERPGRSLTHPLREETLVRKSRVKQGDPFDPDELCRKLRRHQRYLQEQKELRRQAREREAREAKERERRFGVAATANDLVDVKTLRARVRAQGLDEVKEQWRAQIKEDQRVAQANRTEEIAPVKSQGPAQANKTDRRTPVKSQGPAQAKKTEGRAPVKTEGSAHLKAPGREPEASQETSYHHTPKVAAKDFKRTATPDPLKKKRMHKLSRPLLKERSKLHDVNEPIRRPKTGGREDGDVTTSEMHRRRQTLMTAEYDVLMDLKPAGRRTGDIRPLSTGDLAWVDEADAVGDSSPERSYVYGPHDRHDWTESDAPAPTDKRPTLKSRISPLFKHKKSPLNDGRECDAPSTAPIVPTPPPPPPPPDDNAADPSKKRRKSRLNLKALFRKT
ncbi:MAG: hypothetical protein M1824_002355 [Vezdaea acicularis]|nr:MAG: hypothetical protein M1824_002355 [Vezdaea acicularis]